MLVPTRLRSASRSRSAFQDNLSSGKSCGVTALRNSQQSWLFGHGQPCRITAAAQVACSAAAADVTGTVDLESWLASQIITGGSIDPDTDYSSSSNGRSGSRRRRRRLPSSSSSSNRINESPRPFLNLTADAVAAVQSAISIQPEQQQQRTYPYTCPESGQQHVDPSSILARPWAAGIEAAAAAAATGGTDVSAADQSMIATLICKIADWDSSSSSSTTTTAYVQQWDDAFVQGVLSAVAAPAAAGITQRIAERQQRAVYNSTRSSTLTSSSSSGNNAVVTIQQDRMNQQQHLASSPAAAAAVDSVAQQQQQQQQSFGGITDPQVATLLSYVTSDQPPKPWAWQTMGHGSSSSSSSSHVADLISSSSSSQGWGYSRDSSAAAQPRLQRAQWVVEELNRVQYAAASSSNGGSSSSGAKTMAYVEDLQIQLRRLLLSHFKLEITHWRQVAITCEMFVDHLTPQIVCGALTTIQQLIRSQQQQQQQRVIRSRSEQQRVLGLLQRLLGLIWRWRDQLGPRECLTVAWVLVKIKIIKPESKSPLRDALAQRYAAYVAAAAAPRQQQQQPISVYHHASMLLALAELGLQSNALGSGTVRALCRSAVRQIRTQQQQQQQQQSQNSSSSSSSSDPSLPSSISLLLYALSRFKIMPCSKLLKLCGWYTASLLLCMAAADVSLLAIAFGRFGYVPTRFWAGKFLAATAAAAAATTSEIGSSSSSSSSRGIEYLPSAAAAAVSAAAAEEKDEEDDDPSSSSSIMLNPTDVTSMIVAVHSMNVKPSQKWLDAMLAAAAALLPAFDLQQCIVLLLGIHRLGVVPSGHALVSVAEHVTALISSSTSSGVGSSSSSSIDSSSDPDRLGVEPLGLALLSVAERMAAVIRSSSSSSSSEVGSSGCGSSTPCGSSGSSISSSNPDTPDSVLLLPLNQQPQDRQQQHHYLESQGELQRPFLHPFQQRQQQFAAATAAAEAAPVADRWQYARARRLCLYIKALAKATSLLPPDAAATTRQQLLPHVAAAARHLGPHMRHLKPLDLLQLVSGLSDLKCRPGPGFMSAHVSQCEALQRRFNKSMLRQLQQAYQGLGYQPSRALWALMLVAEEHTCVPK